MDMEIEYLPTDEVLLRLDELKKQDISQFLLLLSEELQNDEKNENTRQFDGILLKNSLDDRVWLSVEKATKEQIKGYLLNTLGSSNPEARHIAAHVIAKLASIDIPKQEWDALIPSLLENMSKEDNPASIKQATLESLGYICEVISHKDIRQEDVNQVLAVVVRGMYDTKDCCVRLAAATALHNVLNIAQKNFEKEEDRRRIIKVVCERASATEVDNKVRVAAFKCLVSIASSHYKYLDPYKKTIFDLTSQAFDEKEKLVKSAESDKDAKISEGVKSFEAVKIVESAKSVVIQAFEVWNSICMEEIKLEDDKSIKTVDSHPHFRLIEIASRMLVPMLLETLLKQDLEDGIHSWSDAAGICLTHVARAVGDSVVPLVFSFFEQNLVNPKGKACAAGAHALGSILESPSVKIPSTKVLIALNMLITCMARKSNNVEDTTALSHNKQTILWTICRILKFLHGSGIGFSVILTENIERITKVLLESIKDSVESIKDSVESINGSAHVAEKGCWAIFHLAQGYEGFESGLNVLTPYLPEIIDSLIANVQIIESLTAERKIKDSYCLRYAAYQTLNEVVRCSNFPEASQTINQLLTTVKSKLEVEVASPDNGKKQDLVAFWCGVLHVILEKLSSMEETKPSIIEAADEMMTLFFKIFEFSDSQVNKEAMLATGVLASATGPKFEEHMPKFWKYLAIGLRNFKDYEVCTISVGVVRVICETLGHKILRYCTEIMKILIDNISSDVLHWYVKPPFFSCIGVVARVMGDEFRAYVSRAMLQMDKAADVCKDINVLEEMAEYVNQFKRSIFEAYLGILKGLKNPKAESSLRPVKFMKFIEAAVKDAKDANSDMDESVAKAVLDVHDAIRMCLDDNLDRGVSSI